MRKAKLDVRTHAVYRNVNTGEFAKTQGLIKDPVKLREVIKDNNCPSGYCQPHHVYWYRVPLDEFERDWEFMKEIR